MHFSEGSSVLSSSNVILFREDFRKILAEVTQKICTDLNVYVTDGYVIAGDWGGKSQAGYFSSSSKTPTVIRGRPVFVVDCTTTMEFNKPSKEVDRVVEEIVSFLLGPSKDLR